METLEPRQMLTILPIEGTPFGDFEGNYYPPQNVRYGTTDFLSAPTTGDPLTVAKNYLRANLGPYSLTAADLDNMAVTNNYKDKDGESHLYFQQMYNGLPVAGAKAMVNLTGNNRVISAAANFADVSYPLGGTLPYNWTVNRGQALAAYATHALLTPTGNLELVSGPTGLSQKTVVKQGGLSNDNITMQLHYVPSPGGGVELAWEISAQTPQRDHWFHVSIAAAGPRAGQVVMAGDLVANASYNVFPLPERNPVTGVRSIVIDPQDPVASPFGWHDTNGVPGPEFLDTEGNNAVAQDDIDGNNTGGVTVNGGLTLNFNPTLVLPNTPVTNLEAGILQAFYTVNVAHDIAFHHGFDEFAGNFQTRNYVAGLNQAFGFDAVIIDVQDSSFPNNASMQLTPDGFAPRMTIGISSLGKIGGVIVPINPSRDVALENRIVLHEYFHGVSGRLTGGPQDFLSLQAVQSGGMGEGWSDWFGLLMTLKPTDNRNTPQYFDEWTFPTEGFRRAPYSFDLSINPRRFSDYNQLGDPSLPFPATLPGQEVHNAGEIWNSALMDMSWLLIEKYGFNGNLYRDTNANNFGTVGGNNVAMQLVMDALKLQPPNPSFIEARDAILAADLALTGGDNYDLIWRAMARRGIGFSSNSGVNSGSLVVAEAFDTPQPLGRVQGVVFNDANGNGTRETGELPLAGWTVYVDLNNNGRLDPASERQDVTDAQGRYHFLFETTQTVTIREVLKANFQQTSPQNNAGRTVNVIRGQTSFGQNFGNQGLPGEIRGVKWLDQPGGTQGVRDPGEPGLEGVVIYVDVNNNGVLNVLEPSAKTDANGFYSIKNVPAGTHSIREVVPPGATQTFPLPNASDPFQNGYINQILASGQILVRNFGNVASLDFGDAPNSYGTLLAANGPRHGIQPGLRLGAANDSESNGQPNATATGDDVAGVDDEDGVQFGATAGALATITPGLTKTIKVTVNTGGNSPAKLHGWVDFNQDGDFLDVGERVIANLALAAGVHNVSFAVPASAKIGTTYARFRYGYETDLGPTGASQAGEVEDYQVSAVADFPTAVNDLFGQSPNFIRPGTAVQLDVLANDPPTSRGAPHIIPGTITAPAINGVLTGSTAVLDTTTGQIVYTAADGVTSQESFTYRVSDVPDNSRQSNPGVVRVNVTIRDPRAIDDIYTIQSQADQTPITLGPGNAALLTNNQFVLDNDLVPFAFPETNIIAVQTLTPGLPATTFQVLSTGPNARRTLVFTPPSSNFTGTVIGQYTIDDNDGTTNAAIGRVTVQVVNGLTTPAATHLANIIVELRDPNTKAILADNAVVNVGQLVLLRVRAQDLRPGGSAANRGVEAAYLDLIWNLVNNTGSGKPRPGSDFLEPVLSQGHPLGMNVVFDGTGAAVFNGSVAASPAPSLTSFSAVDDASLDPTDDFYRNMNVVFTSGDLLGKSGRVISYNGTTRTFNFGTNTFFNASGAPATPQPGDTFRVEQSLYTIAQQGEPNSPAAGQVNEAGAFHSSSLSNPVGPGPVTVFSILMRAKASTAGQSFAVFGDPADSDPTTRVTLSGDTTDPGNIIDPDELTDEEVYLQASNKIIIASSGGGEFTNLVNPFDVNKDTFVSPIDAVLVLNELNGDEGPRKLTIDESNALSSARKSLIDVNMDSYLTPIDALLVLNQLSGAQTSGEGEAAGDTMAAGAVIGSAAPASEAIAAVAAGASAQSSAKATTESETSVYIPPQVVTATTSADGSVTVQCGGAATADGSAAGKIKVSKEGADEVFAELFEMSLKVKG